MALPPLTPATVPYYLQMIGTGINLLKSLFGGGRQPPMPPTLSYDEALRRAEDVLNPVYDRHLRDTLKQIDSANIARGFYGQLPGDALARSTAADIQGARASQIANLAQQMVGQSEQQALAQQQLALQWAQQQQAARQQAMSSFANFANTLLNTQFALGQLQGGFPTELASAFGIPAKIQDNLAGSAAVKTLPKDVYNLLIQNPGSINLGAGGAQGGTGSSWADINWSNVASDPVWYLRKENQHYFKQRPGPSFSYDFSAGGNKWKTW